MEIEDEIQNTAIITAIIERKNYIKPAGPSHKMHHHIIAANVDQSLLIATLKDPNIAGIYRSFPVACEAYHVPAYWC